MTCPICMLLRPKEQRLKTRELLSNVQIKKSGVKKKMATWIWIVLIAGVIVAAGAAVGIYFGVQAAKGDATVSPSTTLTASESDATVDMKFVNTSASALNRNAARYETSDLKSLKYALMNINLYEDIQMTGTGWSPSADSSKQATVALYSNGLNLSETEYNNFGFDEAKADDSLFVNMADPSAVAAKMTFSTAVPTGDILGKSFQYMVVNWLKPIKFEAVFGTESAIPTSPPMPILYTKTASNCVQFSGDVYEHSFSIMDSSMTVSGTQETIIVLNNGGFFTKLAQPITFEAGKTYRCILAFNPDSLLKVEDASSRVVSSTPYTTNSDYKSLPGSAGDAYGRVVYVPLLPIVPIVYEEGENVMRETYSLVYTSADDDTTYDFVLRLEVYYRSSSPTAVAGAAVTMVSTNSSSLDSDYNAPATASGIYGIENADDGTVTFQSWDASGTYIKGLTRGESGQCTLGLFHGMGGHHVDPADAVQVTVSYTYSSPDVQIN